MSALLLAFSALRIDCSRWLSECIPDACLKQDDNAIFPQEKLSMLDIDRCLAEMQHMLTFPIKKDQNLSQRSLSAEQTRPRVESNSPVSVTVSEPASTRDERANRAISKSLNVGTELAPNFIEDNHSDQETFTVLPCAKYDSELVACDNSVTDMSHDCSHGPFKKSRMSLNEY